jgi:hypothetical protein
MVGEWIRNDLIGALEGVVTFIIGVGLGRIGGGQ